MSLTPVTVRLHEDPAPLCEALLRALPLWFGIESSLRQYVSDVAVMPTFAASVDDRDVGILALHPHNPFTIEIHLVAVHPDHHRRHIGHALVSYAESYARARGHEFMTVKTLSPSRPNREYELTRKFYSAMGFKPVEEFKTLWGEANPCLLLIKAL
jgi:GNAT superfamily N-acetyltransferase